jgi:hypothetical protein
MFERLATGRSIYLLLVVSATSSSAVASLVLDSHADRGIGSMN